MTDHIFIVNPAAGKADRTEAISNAVKNLSVDGNVEVYTTTAPGDAERFVAERLSRSENNVRLYACGGDGTFFGVINGIYASGKAGVEVGPIPTGSGNDFIKSFPIDASRFRSIKDMAEGKSVPVDLIRITDASGKVTVCANIASAGFDADVCRNMEGMRRIPLVSGSNAYRLSVVKTICSPLGHKFTVLADGKEIGKELKDEYLFVLAANGRYYGGGYKPSPSSVVDDGVLDLVLIEKVGRMTFAKLLSGYRTGEYMEELSGKMIYVPVRTMQILSDAPIDMNLDGEVIAFKDPLIEVIPHGMNFILPA